MFQIAFSIRKVSEFFQTDNSCVGPGRGSATVFEEKEGRESLVIKESIQAIELC
jgi:hypothetical protein